MAWQLRGRDQELALLDAAMASGTNGVVVVGEAGVGKSYMCDEFCRSQESSGAEVLRLLATVHSQQVPLGCLSRLLSDRPGGAGENAVHSAVSEMIARAAESSRLILYVDDIHLADPSTIHVLEQTVAGSSGFLLGTIRASEQTASLQEPLKAGFVDRMELAPLSDAFIEAILSENLDGPIELATRTAIVRLAGGSPLYLRELIEGARSSDDLTFEAGQWRLAPEFTPSTRLTEIVAARLEGLDADEHQALAATCIAEPVPLQVLRAVASDSALEQLERRGFLRVSGESKEPVVVPAHPIYGDVLRTTVGALVQRRLSRELAAAFGEHTSNEDYALQQVRLSIANGDDPPLPVLQQAARSAYGRGDSGLAVDLIERVLVEAPSVDAAVLAAEASGVAQQSADVGRYYEQARELATTDGERTSIALSQAMSLLFSGAADDALALLDATVPHISDEAALLTLHASRAEILGYTGHWSHAKAVATEVVTGDPSPDLLFSSQCLLAFASSFVGPLSEASAVAAAARQTRTQVRNPRPYYSAWLYQTEAYVDVFEGRTDRAVREAADRATEGISRGEADWVGHWLFAAALYGVCGGSVTEERVAYVEESLRLLRQRDVSNMYSFAVSTGSIMSAMAGDLDRAHELQAHYDRDLRESEEKTTALADRAAMWIAARKDGPSAGVEAGFAAAEAVLVSAPLFALPMYHDLARFGHPDLVVDRLTQLAEQLQSTFSDVLADDVRARVRRDRVGLLQVADRYEVGGYLQHAAETLAAADRYSGSANHATRIAQLTSSELVVPMALDDADDIGRSRSASLTPRQREIASLAAEGMSTPEIAAQLHISQRTVSNHLGAIYSELGVDGREELGDALR